MFWDVLDRYQLKLSDKPIGYSLDNISKYFFESQQIIKFEMQF